MAHQRRRATPQLSRRNTNDEKTPDMKTPLLLRYFIWSMLIFAISMGLLSTRALRSLEFNGMTFNFNSRFYLELDARTDKEVDPPVKVIPFYERISQELFLESVKGLTHSLKEAGAKVVIVPLPDYLRPSPRNLHSIRELIRDSIVIFGVSTGYDTYAYAFSAEPALDNKQNWWVRHPMFHRVELPWGVMTEQTKNFGRLTRFVPTGIRDFDKGDPVPDIIVLALKRYFDIPDKAELPASSSRLHIGSYVFPIENDGLTYVRLRTTSRHLVELYASLDLMSDSLTYFPSGANGANDTTTVRSAMLAHRGKIVIIDWSGAGSNRYPTRGWAYANIVSSFFDRSFVKRHNEWSVLLITTLVILLSVVSYTVRNGFMVFLCLGLSVAALAISAWLFNSHNVLFEPVYIIVPILLCGFILPIVKTSGEKRIAVEKAKSLEEENRRLQEVQRSTATGTHF